MKRKISTASLLGINYEEAAIILRISRSQWSMFELGKRSLPLPAMQLLAEMLTYVELPQKNEAQHKFEKDLAVKQLNRLLRENNYQQSTVSRKIEEANKRHETETRLFRLIEFFDRKENKQPDAYGMSDLISGKAAKLRKANVSAALTELQHRHELLAFEKQLLESKLEKLGKA